MTGLQPSGFFAFRAAALPMDVLTAWAGGLEAPQAAGDLAGAIERDRALLRERLTALAARPVVRGALSVASPDLLDAIRTRPDDPGVEGALVRYVVRMASRATPFGLFAACGRGVIGDRTNLALPDPATWRRFTQLDADYLDALVRHRAGALAERVTLAPNDSLHLMAGRWRYVESRLDGLERSHRLVQVAGSKHLQRALDAAAAGATRHEVVAAVAAGGVANDAAAGYTDRLVAAQVLVPNLAVTITGRPPLDSLIADLDVLGDDSTTSVLRQVRDDLTALDAEGPAAPAERHAAVAATLAALPAPVDRARLLHVDATVPSGAATLARATVDDIIRGVEVLRRIAPAPPASDLDRFREAFVDRYETEEVPLLDALDEEMGVGFGGDAARRDPAPLLDGLRLPPAPAANAALGRRERRLLELLHRAWAGGADEILLTKDDVAALENDAALPFPPALAATAVLARTAQGPRVVLTGAGGPSGARLLGRFCHADPGLERDVQAHLRAEEALDPDAVHAEIVHLPSGRMVNVLARPALRDHEIAWLGRSGASPERVLSAGDLTVAVRDGRFVLRSRRLGRRVAPRLTSAHNYDRRSPGVYRFLAAVQADGVAEVVEWTWFPFAHAPFTPRVRLGSVVLARARWSAPAQELRALDHRDPVVRWAAVQAWRGRRRLPRWICLVDGDNVLAVDLDNVLCVDTFVRAVRHREEAVLEELFPGPDELVAAGPGGHHAVEVVVPLVRAAPVTPAPAVIEAPFVRRVFPPGSEWSTLKLYAGSATADRLLVEEVGPLARHLVASGAADTWFFLRYDDPGFHLRVRFHGDPDGLRPALDTVVARVIDAGLAHDAQLATYRREVERYGGPDAIAVAERLFHADSDAVVDLLGLFAPGDAGLDARWRIGLVGAERLLQDLGLDVATRAALSRRMRDAFDGEFRADATLRTGIAGRVRDELGALDGLLEAAAGGDHPLAPGIGVLDERSARMAPLARDLRAGRLTAPVEEVAASFVHMWLNRLHRSENRFHEYVTYALLARLHEACGAGPPPPMTRDEVLARTVFTVDGEALTWADVVDAAKGWGEWDVVANVAGGTVEERATAFRRRRGLLSADETQEWFGRWGVTVPEWLAHLRDETGADSWVAAVVSGTLERTAHRLAGALAAHRAIGGTGRPATAELDAAMAEFSANAATPDRIAAAIVANRLAWTALDLESAGERHRVTLADAGPDLAPLLVGAAAGDTIGGAQHSFLVLSRHEPTVEDPDSAARARTEVVAAALRREVSLRVRWLEPVAEPPGEAAAPAEETADDGDTDFQRPARRIRRFPTVWAIDEADCGAACLAAVCRHFGRAVPLPAVRDAVATAVDGTSLGGLAAGAERLGLAARALRASTSRLDTLPLPAICHWRGDHWVVLHHTDERSVRVMDPVAGPRRIPRAEWEEHWSGFSCLVAPTPALADVPEGRPPWRWLLPFFRPYRRPFAAAAVLGLAAAGLEMLIPLAAGRIVDGAIAEGDRGQLHLLALGMLGVLLAAVTAGLVQRWLLARVAVRFDGATLDHVTERLLALPATYFGSRRTGDIERRVAGMRQIRLFLVQQGVVGMTAAAQVVVAVAIMTVLSPRLAGVYVATVPFYAAAMVFSRRRLRPILASLEESFGAYHSRQIDAIRGIDTVKARGAEPALQGLMRRQFDALAGRVYRSDLAFMRYDAAVALVTFLTLALVLWAGGLFVLGGDLSIGELVAFNGLVVLANGPAGTLLRLWDELQYASVLLGRLDDVLAQEPEQGRDRSRLQPVPALRGRVSIQGLTVRTGGPVPATILDDVSIEVQPGETVALVGRSGAGKTTLVRCMAGLLPATSGRILYDGVDLDDLDHRELRRRIGFVLQDDHLFDGTFAANIALGDEDVDLEQVRWAARAADAAGFIERLPLAYATRIGETGMRLSGGQAQRVAIARAVYRRPSILILDEATSSLDAESEQAVHQGIDELLHGRTAFVIAHRLSTVREADRIVVLDRGRVVEQGTHQELLARRSLYWYLAGQQLDS